MTDFKDKQENDFLLSFSDLTRLIRVNKRRIYLGAIVFAALAFFYGLFKPVQYEAEASFKEKSKSKPGVGEAISFMFMTEGQTDSDALTMMSSRKLIEELVKDQGLQVVIHKDEYEFPLLPITTIKNNLIAEYASLTRSLVPLVKSPVKDLKAEQIIYQEGIPTALHLQVISQDDYIITDGSKESVGRGVFGVPFATDKFAFTITRLNHENIKGNTYSMTLFPLEYIADNMTKQFIFKQDKNDKNLLKITHKNSDRDQAAKNVNVLMAMYLKYIQCEHENLCQMQISYLRERQGDMGNQLETMMQAHAEKLSSDLSATGFATSEKAMEFLAANQHRLKEKLFSVDIEIQRFEKAQKEGSIDSELLSSSYDLSIINNITAEKRRLKQQLNSLDLALRNSPKHKNESKTSVELPAESNDEIKHGLDLNIAKDIYLGYVKELNEIESKKVQHDFMLNQMDDPGFEITSLSTILSDPISMDMIVKTSTLLLTLKDYDNRSIKEQERLLSDLAIQKNFLKTHVMQSNVLLELRQNFVREKIEQLQNVMMSLIEEQLSILEIQLKEHIINALGNLKQEREIIEENLAQLRLEMASFPQQWAAEQLISQQMSINKALVEEVSRVVESKNISNNLEKFQSAPIDLAVIPLHPKSPRLILLVIIGAIVGAFLSGIWILGKSIAKGIDVTQENLRLAGYHVAGKLSGTYTKISNGEPLLDGDLNTLRRLIAYMTTSSKNRAIEQTLLLLEGNGPDYSSALAELISRQGAKVLLMDLRFGDYSTIVQPGMLQYLEGKVAVPSIVKGDKYDYIPSGGIYRYSNELMSSQKFKQCLTDLALQYEWIIASSSVSPKSAEVDSLLDQFPNFVASVTDEKMHQLRSCFSHAKNPDNIVSFIIF